MNNNISFSSEYSFICSLREAFPRLYGSKSVLDESFKKITISFFGSFFNFPYVEDENKKFIISFLIELEKWAIEYPLLANELETGVVYLGTDFNLVTKKRSEDSDWILLPSDIDFFNVLYEIKDGQVVAPAKGAYHLFRFKPIESE